MQEVEQLLSGDRRALARLITLVENHSPGALEALRLLHPKAGRARTVGITGPSGAGKSSLVNQLAKELRRRGKSVGIVAVDPSSPLTQGAFLGDRIRMQELGSDSGIFIRSMAARGAVGGLAEATNDVVTVLDAFGMDVVLVETVGVGQDEVEVARTTQSTVVVGIPGGGDAIQAMKAGILEIADIFVVNKADRDGADALVAELRQLLSLAEQGPQWKVPIVKTIATENVGIDTLADAIDAHAGYLRATGRFAKDQLERTRHQILALARQELFERLLSAGERNGELEHLVQAVSERELDPRTAAQRLIAQVTTPIPGKHATAYRPSPPSFILR